MEINKQNKKKNDFEPKGRSDSTHFSQNGRTQGVTFRRFKSGPLNALWLLYVVTLCGYSMWLLYVVTLCGYSMWLLYVVTLCACSLCLTLCVSLYVSHSLCLPLCVSLYVSHSLCPTLCVSLYVSHSRIQRTMCSCILQSIYQT